MLKRRSIVAAVIFLAVVFAGGTLAQEAGRTSGPEGEEDIRALVEFRHAQRLGPDGTFSPDALMKAKWQLDAKSALTVPPGRHE
jgi:hypothetical protein